MTRAEIDWLYPIVNVKDQVLGTSSEGLFWTPSDRISHCIHIVRTSCSQLPDRSRIFWLLVEVFYCSLKFVYPTINLAFLEIVVKVNFPVKFCLHSFKWFCLQINSNTKYFSSLVQGIVIELLLFSNLKQKRTQHY